MPLVRSFWLLIWSIVAGVSGAQDFIPAHPDELLAKEFSPARAAASLDAAALAWKNGEATGS